MSCYANAASEIASLENDGTISSDTSHYATSGGMIAYATPREIRDGSHGESEFLNAPWSSQPHDFTDQVDELACEAPLALTQQALQQHNAKNIPAAGKATDNCLFDENHMKPNPLGDTATNTSTMDGNVCLNLHLEPCSYPRRCSKHRLSIPLANMDDQTLDSDIKLLPPPAEHQGLLYTYPTFISEGDLYDHLPDPEFYDDPSNTKPSSSEFSFPEEVSFQVPNSWSNEYAGIGTQFSS